MPRRTRRYEEQLIERLHDREYALEYLNAVLADVGEDADGRFLVALRRVAQAQGMPISQLAEDASLGRQALYRSLSENGNPEFATLTRVLRALGLRLAVADAA